MAITSFKANQFFLLFQGKICKQKRSGLRVHTITNNESFEEGKSGILWNKKYFLCTFVQSATSRKTPISDASNAKCVQTL